MPYDLLEKLDTGIEILGRADEPSSPPSPAGVDILGPLIPSPREKRRKAIADFDAGASPISVSATEFGRGVSKGALDIASTTAGFGEALADLIGADSAKAWLKEKGDKLDELNRAIPLATESFTDIESPSDIPAYVAMSVGKLAPQIALSMGAGLAARGAATGASAARRIAAGAFATSYPQEVGGMYRGTREETGKEAPLTALALGAPSAALDSLTPTRFLGKIFSGAAGEKIKEAGWRSLVKQSFKEAGKTGLIEAGTETAQESLAVAANRFADSTYPLLTERNAIRLIDAGLQGLIGGSVIGASQPTLKRLAEGGQPTPQKVSTPKPETGGIDDTPPRIVTEQLTPTQEPNATQPITQQPGAVTEPARDVQQLPTQTAQEPAGIVDSSQLRSPTQESAQAPAVAATQPQGTIFESGGATLGAAPSESPTFYSRLQRTVETSPQQKASGAQWKATIKQSKLGANADEMALVGVDSLEDAKPYTKAEVLGFLRDNEIQVKEVAYGEPEFDVMTYAEAKASFGSDFDSFGMFPDQWLVIHDGEPLFPVDGRTKEEAIAGAKKDYESGFDNRATNITKYSQYQLGGGEEGTYREWVLSAENIAPTDYAVDAIRSLDNPTRWTVFFKGGTRLSVRANSKQEALATVPIKEGWRDGHSSYNDIPNPVVRLRGAIHTTTDGKRMLLIEEVQAPQKGEFEKMPALFQAKWRDIGFKFALRKAAELGVDQLGWTTGKTQAARYSLSKQISSEGLKWSAGDSARGALVFTVAGETANTLKPFIYTVGMNELESVVGKDISARIQSDYRRGVQSGTIQGDDLSIGGEGLTKLYDTDFRNVVNSLASVKKAGVKVGTADINTSKPPSVGQQPNGRWQLTFPGHETITGFVSEEMAIAAIPKYEAKFASGYIETVHSIPIPASLRASVLEGQPLASFTAQPTGFVRQDPDLPALFQRSQPVEGSPFRQASWQGETFLFNPDGQLAIRRTDPIRKATSIAEALDILHDPASGIDRTVVRALSAVLSTPGLKLAAEKAGFRFDFVAATNALLNRAEGAFDPVTGAAMLAYNAVDPLTGPHEVAHSLEKFLAPKQKELVRSERSAALAKALQRTNLTTAQRELLQAISTQERSSEWFETALAEQGTQILEFYPLVNSSEFFAQSFASWFLKRHNASAGYRAFITAIKDFLSKIYEALRRAFGAQGTMEAIHRALISGDFDVTLGTGTLLGTRDVLSSMPQLWTTRQKADAAMSLRGLPPQRLAEAQRLANVQGGMVPDATAYLINQLSPRKNTPQGYAKQLLQFIMELRRVAQSPAALASVPRGTPEEQRVATVAANTLLGHHSRIVEQRQRFESKAAEAQAELTSVMQTQQPKMVAAQLKSQFLEQLAARLIRDYGDFVDNQARTLSAGQNYDAATDTELRKIQDNINNQSRNPAGLIMALEKIADAIPTAMLASGATPIDIANWVAGNQPLRATLGQANLNFLISPIMGTSPLAQYADLPQRLATIKQIKADGQAAEAAMQSFRTWFQNLHVGGRHVSPLSIARAYAKFRMEQQHAADIATGIEERIDRLDRDLRGNLMAVDIINEMIASPEYRANLTLASNDADFVVKEITETGGTGQVRYVGPISQQVYTVDLTPGKAQEQANLQQLGKFVEEIDTYLATPDADPILARSYTPLRDYIQRYLLDPWLSPENSALKRTWNIGPLRVPIGQITGAINAAFRGVGYSIQTPQALLDKIGGRAAREALHEWQLSDHVTTQFRPLNEDKNHGIHAQNIKNLKAAVAHGFPKTPFGIQTWQDEVIEPILASRQNDLGRPLGIGQKTPAGHTITALDMDAAKTMKGFTDPIVRIVQNTEPGGHPLQTFNPIRISDEVAGRAGTRKAIAHGDMVMARHFHNWARGWVRRWTEANTPAKKLAALGNRQDFVEAALRRVRETNPEYSGQSSDQTQQAVYADIAYEQDQPGAVPFQTIDQLLDRIATGRYQALSPHQNTSLAQQRTIAQDVLLGDITADVEAFNKQVEEIEPWTKGTGGPPTMKEITESQNSFTKARLGLVAPSSYYQYGIASDAAKMRFQHGARQIFQLRQIEAMERLLTVLKAKQDEWKKRVHDLQRGGISERQALKTVKEQTRVAVEQGDFMADWADLNELVKDLSVTLDEARRVAQQSSSNYYSEALGFVMNVQGTLASQLLSGVGSIIANLSGATNVTTALTDAHLGRWNPLFMGKQALRRSGRMAATALSGMANINNRGIVRALRRHGPAFQALADTIDDFADLWASGRMADERIGAVSPYQFSQRTQLQSALGRTGGRVEFETPSMPIAGWNRIQSLPGIRQFIEGIKATMPRATDMLANIANTKEVERMVEELKRKAVKAWSAREATGSPDWRNTSTKAGLLSNRELGFSDSRAARYFRDLFSPIGQLEVITQRYYDAQKTDPNAPLLSEGEYDALLLEYLKSTNLATESNRPLTAKGGQIRSFVGLFRGWGGWMWQQIDKMFQQHRGDEKNWLPAIASIVMLMLFAAIIGAVNREAGYEIKQVLTGETTKDIRLPAVLESGDVKELMRYTALAWANTLPYIGEAANRAFGGTSSRPFMDATAIVPILGLAQSAYDSMEKIVVTGDPVYPMVDFMRRWSPAMQPVLNRLPVIQGDIAQRNALRAIQSTVPAGMEVREMAGGRFRGTPMTPVLRDIVSAAYTGDTARMNAAIARGIAMKEQVGALDGASELAQNLKGYMPQRRLFGRDITATEESRLIGRMTDRQRGHYDQSKQAFTLIGTTLAGMKKPTRSASRRSGRRRRTGLGRTSGLLGRRRRQRRLRL